MNFRNIVKYAAKHVKRWIKCIVQFDCTKLCALFVIGMMNFRIFNRIMETRQSKFYCTLCFSDVPIEKRIRGMLLWNFVRISFTTCFCVLHTVFVL